MEPLTELESETPGAACHVTIWPHHIVTIGTIVLIVYSQNMSWWWWRRHWHWHLLKMKHQIDGRHLRPVDLLVCWCRRVYFSYCLNVCPRKECSCLLINQQCILNSKEEILHLNSIFSICLPPSNFGVLFHRPAPIWLPNEDATNRCPELSTVRCAMAIVCLWHLCQAGIGSASFGKVAGRTLMAGDNIVELHWETNWSNWVWFIARLAKVINNFHMPSWKDHHDMDHDWCGSFLKDKGQEIGTG